MSQDKHGEKITFRLDPELKEQLEKVMAVRGIKKISDFSRQAVAAHILRIKTEMALEEHKMAVAMQALEAEARGEKPLPFDPRISPPVTGKKISTPQAGTAGPVVPVPRPPKAG